MAAKPYLGSRDPVNLGGAAPRQACSLGESHVFFITFRQIIFIHGGIFGRRRRHAVGSRTWCGSPSQSGFFRPRRPWLSLRTWLHPVRELMCTIKVNWPCPKRHKLRRAKKTKDAVGEMPRREKSIKVLFGKEGDSATICASIEGRCHSQAAPSRVVDSEVGGKIDLPRLFEISARRV